MSRSPHVHITEFGRSKRPVELRSTATIGRDSDNDIVLEENTVSRCHAVLLVGVEGVVLMDLGSTNGAFVNGKQALPGDHPKPGDYATA